MALIGSGIVSASNYKALVNRGRLRVVRPGKGKGMYALVAFDSLRPDIKQRVIAIDGNPYAEQEEQKKREEQEKREVGYVILNDTEADSFFAAHLVNGVTLGDKLRKKYTDTANIMNAIVKKYNDRKAALLRRPLPGVSLRKEEYAHFFAYADALAEKYPNDIPRSFRRFWELVNEYWQRGYVALVSEKIGNANRVAICPEAGGWATARFASHVNRVTLLQLLNEYNAKAPQAGWKPLKSLNTLRSYLYQPEVMQLWYGARYGELKAKEKFERQHRTVLPTLRDALWYGDGTKLNYYYRDESGRVCTCNVYEVVDVYSERLLGYHISPTEDFEAQYMAYKMAVKTAGYLPYELKFDNQGGHKKLQSGDFLKKLARLATTTAPYNGKSKTIESVFKRFQSDFLHKDWFFTGQNVTAKKEESRANMEFIMANKANLPTLDEVRATYARRRAEWNAAPHYDSGMPREQMYRESRNPKATKVELLQFVELFWITTAKPSTYRAGGLEIQVKNTRYAYEVQTVEHQPDLDFLAANVGKKFYVRYDPDDMTLVQLYEGTASGLRFVASAEPYITVHRDRQSQEGGDAAFLKAQELLGKTSRMRRSAATEELLERHGQHPSQHGLNMPNIRGVTSARGKRREDDFAMVEKAIANMTPELELAERL